MYLEKIDSPADLKKLDRSLLPKVAEEIRELIIRTVAKTGGHLASNLGTVELTLALHYVYDSPTDKILWDVSHQAYAHKIVTGRRDRFPTLRQERGLSGFTTEGIQAAAEALVKVRRLEPRRGESAA